MFRNLRERIATKRKIRLSTFVLLCVISLAGALPASAYYLNSTWNNASGSCLWTRGWTPFSNPSQVVATVTSSNVNACDLARVRKSGGVWTYGGASGGFTTVAQIYNGNPLTIWTNHSPGKFGIGWRSPITMGPV